MKEKDSDVFHYLITHTGFRDWVQNPNEDSNYFWKRWIDENPGDILELKKARELIEKMHFRKEHLSPCEQDDLLGKIIANEASSYHSRVKHPKSNWRHYFDQWLKVAAVLLIFIVAGVIFHGILKEEPEQPLATEVEWVTLKNPKGRKSKLTLPDGTLVNLNYESQLRFPTVFEGSIRKVELIGEAFFDVVANDTMPFVVQVSDLETEVLGTSLNIKSNEEESTTDVSLVTGKVKVSRLSAQPSEKEVLLSPGEQLSYNRNSCEVVVKHFELETVTAWKDGVIIFKDAALEEFVTQLERWYGVNFQIYGTPSTGWKINGRYQDEKLDDILIGLKFVYGLEYQMQGKNVILNFK